MFSQMSFCSVQRELAHRLVVLVLFWNAISVLLFSHIDANTCKQHCTPQVRLLTATLSTPRPCIQYRSLQFKRQTLFRRHRKARRCRRFHQKLRPSRFQNPPLSSMRLPHYQIPAFVTSSVAEIAQKVAEVLLGYSTLGLAQPDLGGLATTYRFKGCSISLIPKIFLNVLDGVSTSE
jgi:hypothetical protein